MTGLPPTSAPPAPPPHKSDPGHLTIAGKQVSWDAVMIAGGSVLGLLLLLKGRKGSSTSTMAVVPATGVAPIVDSTLAMPMSGITDPPAPAPTTVVPDYWTALYQSTVLRQPDAPGLSYWQGESAKVGQAQATSEFQATPEAQVVALYANQLNRAPDPSGEAYWIAQEQAKGSAATAAAFSGAVAAGGK